MLGNGCGVSDSAAPRGAGAPEADLGQGMTMGRIVLVTGVSRYLGGLFARKLSADPAVP